MQIPFFNTSAREARDSSERIAVSDPRIAEIFGNMGGTVADVPVTTETALGVPAIWAAVNFLSGTLAGLPLGLYKKTTVTVNGEKKPAREKLDTPLARTFSRAPNDEQSSFAFRKKFWESVLTEGRGLAYIERDGAGRVNLFFMDPAKTQVKRAGLKIFYEYREGQGKAAKQYQAADVLDIPFMLRADGLTARSPLHTCREAIAVMIAAQNYGSRFFAGGGVPPIVVTGNFLSAKALKNAATDLWEAIRNAARQRRNALTLPLGLEAKTIGVDPEKSQLEGLLRFGVEQTARMYSLPPVFLQDLQKGTFNNTEQQDVQLVKHTLRRWVEHFEQEVNLKIFGRGGGNKYIEHNLDGIQRGDFKTRMDGYSAGVMSGVLTPAEARAMENRGFEPGTDRAFIQGAMIPIQQAGENFKAADGVSND